MRLRDLEPEFVRFVPKGWQATTKIEEAHGVSFLCPKCQAHYVLCWFRDRGVPDDAVPGPGRWSCSGSSLDDISLSPSVNLPGTSCGWHGFVVQGVVTNA
jgi:hypothetical protein